jgi:hypothetical protein
LAADCCTSDGGSGGGIVGCISLLSVCSTTDGGSGGGIVGCIGLLSVCSTTDDGSGEGIVDWDGLTVDCGTCDEGAREDGDGLTEEVVTGATCGFVDFSLFGVLAVVTPTPLVDFRFLFSRSAVILNGPDAGAVFGLSLAFD